MKTDLWNEERFKALVKPLAGVLGELSADLLVALFMDVQKNALESKQAEVESWKKRAAQHGCNTEEGDHECG